MDMRDRYKLPDSDQPVHDLLRHAYQPPPRPPRPPVQQTVQEHDAIPASRPHHPAPAAYASNKQMRRKLWTKLISIVIILCALAGAGVFAYPRYINPNPFPASIRHDAKLSLLYPAKLPAGYQIDKSSFSLANNILIYAAVNGDKRIAFTLQPTPSGFDFNSFAKQTLTGSQQFLTTFGQATVGKNGSRYLGSLPDGDTWLLISSNSPSVSLDDMSLVLTHLKKY